jgi:hypothetical protein
MSSVITGIPLLISVGISFSYSVRQRTDKEAVAAGLFAVLSRKRSTVSGQAREEPDQFGCFMGNLTLLLPLRCCPSFPFACSAKTNKDVADSLL